MLTLEEVARHMRLRPDTVRRHVRVGRIQAMRVGRAYRVEWPEVWACEDGPMPCGRAEARYRTPLMTKRELADALRVSVRTIDRFVDAGLPTRNVFGRVRFNRSDAEDWLTARFGAAPQLSGP